MSASPIYPSDFDRVTEGATACDHLAELAETRRKVQDFLEWLLTDDEAGNLGTGFKEAIIQQLLFDAAKKGWFVRTNAATGYLELVEHIPLEGLSGVGATDGDTITWDEAEEEWVVTSAPDTYLAPTSGGTTVPAITSGGILSVPHGLSATPSTIFCYLECNATDVGYSAGDRVDAGGLIILRDTAGEQMSAVTVGADGTLLFAVFQVRAGAGGEYRLVHKSTFARAAIDPSKWNVKFYAAL